MAAQVDRPEAMARKAMAEEVLAKLKSEWRKDSSAEKKRHFVESISAAQAEIDEAERCIREPAWSTEQATKESMKNLFSHQHTGATGEPVSRGARCR